MPVGIKLKIGNRSLSGGKSPLLDRDQRSFVKAIPKINIWNGDTFPNKYNKIRK